MSTSTEPRRGLVGQIQGLDDRFWIVNTMEMLERLAYYGVRTVIPLYMVLGEALGGPEFSQVEKGAIFAWWAFVQSMVPMYMGGLADRYGHKNTVAVAVGIKIVGYLLMAVPPVFYRLLLGAESPWAHTANFYGFMLACLLLALGTAIFKPGVQGTLAAALRKEEASLGWGIFYQMVNVGGFLGPILAGVLRQMDWTYVFLSCAIIVALNFAWLPFYTTPTEQAREEGRKDAEAKARAEAEVKANYAAVSQSITKPISLFWAILWSAVNPLLAIGWFAGLVPIDGNSFALLTLMFGLFQVAFYVFIPLKARFDEGRSDFWSIVVVSTVGIFQFRVFFFAIAFAGFWLMFNQVFDLLPNVIDDWVDSSDILGAIGWAFDLPAIPVSLGVVFAVLMAGLAGAVVFLGLRPDRRKPAARGVPSYAVVGLAYAGAFWPAVHLGVTETGSAAYLPVATGFLPAISLILTVIVGGLFGAIWMAFNSRALIVAAIAAGIGLLTWGYAAIGSLLASATTFTAMAEAGGQVKPEYMLNLNAGMIVFTMVFFGYLSGFMRPLTSIMLGMVVAIGGAVFAGTASIGFACLGGIAIFSIGEMLSSPKKMEYLATLARKGQEGLFMGYANVPVAIGWIAGSIFAGNRYEEIGDKVNLAKRHLTEELGVSEAVVEEIPKHQVVPTLGEKLGMDALEAQSFLYQTYDPWWIWVEVGAIGLVSLACMIVYDQVIRAIDRKAVTS